MHWNFKRDFGFVMSVFRYLLFLTTFSSIFFTLSTGWSPTSLWLDKWNVRVAPALSVVFWFVFCLFCDAEYAFACICIWHACKYVHLFSGKAVLVFPRAACEVEVFTIDSHYLTELTPPSGRRRPDFSMKKNCQRLKLQIYCTSHSFYCEFTHTINAQPFPALNSCYICEHSRAPSDCESMFSCVRIISIGLFLTLLNYYFNFNVSNIILLNKLRMCKL